MKAFTAAAFLISSLAGLADAYVHEVIVGGPGKLLYTPEYVHADVGDTIRFIFQQKNHTATQSSFKHPCTALGGYGGYHAGFDSGFMPVDDNVKDDFPYFDIHVKNKKPIWAYCRQVNHCSQGMVFAVNPGDKFKKFKQRALDTAEDHKWDDDNDDDHSNDDHKWDDKEGGDDHYGNKPGYDGNYDDNYDDEGYDDNHDDKGYDDKYDDNYGSQHHKSKNYKVVVGGAAGNVYTPNNIRAKPGDTVTFIFKQKNHTVTQSSFDDPCRKLEFTSPTGEVGFDSGFNPVGPDVKKNFPTWTLHVKDEKPLWAYCRQVGHCGQGMVFAVNAPKRGNTFDKFKANAIRINGTDATGGGSYGNGNKPSWSDDNYDDNNDDKYNDDKYNDDKYNDDKYTDGGYNNGGNNGEHKPKDHRIVVGGDAGNVYTPNNIQADIGDTVTFIFKQKNHTVTESSFDDPCRKLEFTSPTGEVGFDTGFMPVGPDVKDNFPTYTLHVKDKKPLWGYCRQVGHCGQGMVFAVNAPKEGNTFDKFKANAIRINGTDATGSSTTGVKPVGAADEDPNSEFAITNPTTCSSGGAVASRALVYTSFALNAAMFIALLVIAALFFWSRRAQNKKARSGSKYFAVQEDKLGEYNPSLLGGEKMRPLSLGSSKEAYYDDPHDSDSRHSK